MYLDFYEFNADKEEELIHYLTKETEVFNLMRSVGDWDIVIDFYIKKIEDLEKTFFKFLSNFRSIIKNYDIELVIKDKIIPRRYLTKEKGAIVDNFEVGGNSQEKIDNTDYKIIDLLAQNARTPIIEIASKLKMTSMAVIHRIRHLMKKKVILGYKANLDLNKINYVRYRIFFELEDVNILGNLYNYCEKKNFVVMVTRVIGNNIELVIDIKVDRFKQISDLIYDIKKRFPEKIRNYKYIKFIEYYKS